MKAINAYTSSRESEKICNSFHVQADIFFAFKVAQKESPFFYLFLFFVLTCLVFGMAVRNFELYYWETQTVVYQDWTYLWNAMWCIFVTLTTGKELFILL